ncbi:MAG: hypothetical protein AAB731_00985, partial [Patescibacteria group bacterium]
MTPRKRIGSAGYAINSDTLDGYNTSLTGGSTSFVPVTTPGGDLIITGRLLTSSTLYITSTSTGYTPNIRFSATGTFFATPADAAGNSAFVLDTTATLTTSTVFSIRNNGAEVFNVSYDGSVKTTSAIRDAIGWIQNQNQNGKLVFGYNNGASPGATPGNFSVTGTDFAFFDTTAVNANSKGFEMSIFDGRYIYFIPYLNENSFSGQVTRYDTAGSFGSAGSWSVYDTTAVNANSKGFHGAVFDGRYIYFVPYFASGFSGQVTRYDTAGSFTSASSWSVYDTTAVNANSKGFAGGVFDGRYVYFVPYVKALGGGTNGQVTRYDTTGSFGSAGSWSVFDTAANVNANSKGFAGGTFDGRYVYFIPNTIDADNPNGQVTRYDTTGSFGVASSWSVFDTAANVNANSKGFAGGVFDGRYLYLVPESGDGGYSYHGKVTRYDTAASFSSASSWSVY